MSAAFRPYRGGGSPPEGGFELGVDLDPALPSDAPRLPEQSSAIKYNQEQSTQLRAIKYNQECLACSSLGSLVIGLLHRSIVFAADCEALPHQDSHQSHSSGKEWMGT